MPLHLTALVWTILAWNTSSSNMTGRRVQTEILLVIIMCSSFVPITQTVYKQQAISFIFPSPSSLILTLYLSELMCYNLIPSL